MGKPVKQLKYTSGALYGILTSSTNDEKYDVLKESLLNLLNNKVCYILVYNTEKDFEERKEKIKSWDLNYEGFLDAEQILTVSSEIEYLKDDKLDIECIYNFYCNLIDKCSARGYEKVIIHGNRDYFYRSRLTVDEFYSFNKMIKQLAQEKNVMVLTNFFIDEFSDEFFYGLVNLYNMLMLYDSGTLYCYDSEKVMDTKIILKYLKSILKDKALLHSENKKLEFLNELIIDASYNLTDDELLDTSLRRIAEITDLDFGYVIKFSGEDLFKNKIVGKYNLPYDFIEELEKLNSISYEVIYANKKNITILIKDDFENPQRIYMNDKYSIKTVVEIPIGLKDSPNLGLMILYSHRDEKTIHEHIPFLEAVGSTLLILIKKQKMNEDYQKHIIRTEKLRVLGELAGGIAHDFNNLLTTILGFSQIALLNELNGDIKDYINIIYKSALDGKRIVERIQNFNRKQYDSKKEIQSINSIVETSIDMSKPRWKTTYESYGANLKIVSELNSTSNILCTEHEIREVVLNILLNAMDAMEEGGTLTVKTYDEGNKAVIEVKDTGVGIPNEIKEEIFEPFYSTKGTKGTGLGLSIAKGIIEEHNGIIILDSVVGKGSSFKLYFDIFKENLKNVEILDTETRTDILKGLEVLVVDDNEQVGVTISQMIETIGVNASTEIIGLNVMDRLVEKKYDIIICDLAMPELNGIDLSRLVRSEYPNIKFILATGWLGSFKDKVPETIDYIMNKPCTFEDLKIALETVIK